MGEREGLVARIRQAESERQSRLIAELPEQVQPAAMGASLSRDARDRGLE